MQGPARKAPTPAATPAEPRGRAAAPAAVPAGVPAVPWQALALRGGLPAAVGDALAGGHGQPLPDAAGWSRRVGADVSGARLVTGGAARRAADALGTAAFTVGQRVFLGGQGRAVLGHELTHVAQQRAAPLPTDRLARLPAGHALEREAAAQAPRGGGTRVAPMALACAPDEPLLGSRDWFNDNQSLIWGDLQTRSGFDKAGIEPGSPYLRWTYGATFQAFAFDLQRRLAACDYARLAAVVAPGDLDAALRRARSADENGLGPKTYNVNWPVMPELVNLLVPAFAAALRRVGPQYVAASYLATVKERKQSGHGDWPFYGLSTPPPAGALVALRPADRLVIATLEDSPGHHLSVDLDRYTKEGHARTAKQELVKLRELHFTWEAGRGQWLWVRVTSPADPRPEEVAAVLYGDAALAPSLIAAAPWFGFDPRLLAPVQYGAWKALVTAPGTPTTPLNPFGTALGDATKWAVRHDVLGPFDPALELLAGPGGDAAAMAQAKALPPTGKGRDEVVRRLRESVGLIDGMRAEILSTGAVAAAEKLMGVRQKVDDRSKTLAAADGLTELLQWDAQSAAQNALLRRAANGVHHAIGLYRGFAGSNRAGPGQADRVPAYAMLPLQRMLGLYADAAGLSDLVQTGGERLEQAEQASQQFPLDLLDGVLQSVREMLAAPDVYIGRQPWPKPDPNDQYSHKALLEMEPKLRQRVYDARALLAGDPAAAQKIVDEIQQQVTDLQGRAVIVSVLSGIAAEINFIHDNLSTLGSATGKNRQYIAAADELTGFYNDFWVAMLYFRDPGTQEAGRQQLAKAQQRVPVLIERMKAHASMVENEEASVRWLALGLKVAALIAIAVVTAGVGSYVSGALLVGAGWGATTAGVVGAALLSSGAEALTFTALSTSILGRDPQQGLLESFLTNWALFGALKGLSLAYEGAIGARAAATLPGKAGNVTLGLAAALGYALKEQDEQLRKSGGRGLTRAQATETVAVQLVVFIGTALLSRYAGKGFLEGAYLRGAGSRWAGRLAIVDAVRLDAFKAALRISKGGTIVEAQDALAKDAEALAAERRVLEDIQRELQADPRIAVRMGLDLNAINAARSLNELQLDANVRASVGVDLRHVGGDRFECAPGQLDGIVKKLRGLGDQVTQTVDPLTRERSAHVQPQQAPEMWITEPAAAPEAKPGAGASAPDPALLELAQMRQRLSPEAQEAFDRLVAQNKDPRNALKALKRMGERMDEILSRKTQDARAQAAAAPRAPFGPALEQAQAVDREMAALDAELRGSDLQGLVAWLKRLKPLRERLDTLLSGGREATPEEVATVRKHMAALRAELESARERSASRVNVDQTYTDEQGAPRTVDIDNIGADGKTWTEVKDYNLFGPESDTYTQEILPKAQALMRAARQARQAGNPVARIEFDFRRGVTQPVKDALQALSEPGLPLQVSGEVKAPPPKPTGSGGGTPPAGGSGPAPGPASPVPATPDSKATGSTQGAFRPGQAPRNPAAVTQFLRDAGLEESEIIGFGGADASRLGPRTAGRVARLAEHFTASDLKALGRFLWIHDLVLGDAMAQALMRRVAPGTMPQALQSMERAAVYAEQTGAVFDLAEGLELRVAEPRAPADPTAPAKAEPPWRSAERELGPVLEQTFGPGWQASPRILAPNAQPGETLGSTVPEYYHPGLKKAFEVKRFVLAEMGIQPDGRIGGPPSPATTEALARARRQLAGRRWALPAGTEQNLVFNVTGQGVTDVAAVGARLRVQLGQSLVAYDRVYVQDGSALTPVP